MNKINFSPSVLLCAFFFFSCTIQADQREAEAFIKSSNEYLMKRTAEAEEHQNSILSVSKKIASAFMYGLIALFNNGSDIEFYGKVIDQQGNPVTDASIEFYGASGYLTEGSGFNKVTSNEQGFFHITDNYGSRLLVKKIAKEGYEITLPQRVFEHGQRFSDSVQIKSHAKQNNPYIFYAWKQHEGVINTFAGGSSRALWSDGRSYQVNFLPRELQKPSNSLNVQFINEGNMVHFKLTMQMGELLEVEQIQYMSLAPDKGYQTQYLYTFDISESRYKNYEKYFYYKTAANGFYGKLTVDVNPFWRGKEKSYISYRYMTNLDKTRILEHRKRQKK